MSPRSWSELEEDLSRRFGEGDAEEWRPDVFNALATEAFALQFETISVYRGFCEARGRTPDDVSDWRDVPSVPATALKHVDLCVVEPQVVFRTSGTTRGGALRGRHLVPSTSLYRASLLPPFETHVMAGRSGLPFVSLIPSPAELPDSSLSFMVGAAADHFATRAHWLVRGDGAFDGEALLEVSAQASGTDEPVLLLGTALALLRAVELLEDRAVSTLPEGSRIMETGGFKGADREIGRAELYERLTSATGVPAGRIVSEYGMTELLSQLYVPVLSQGGEAGGRYVPPPWLKVRALDPTTLDEVAPGEEGLLCFFDLANAGSVCHVLTEDVGTVVDGRVELRGRVRGSEPRGCSRAMDELMTVAGARP